jgi:hypothetical protein
MRKFRNITELELYKQKLKYRELMTEKELAGTTAEIIEHFSDKLKDFAFDFGTQLILLLFKNKKHNVDPSK